MLTKSECMTRKVSVKNDLSYLWVKIIFSHAVKINVTLFHKIKGQWIVNSSKKKGIVAGLKRTYYRNNYGYPSFLFSHFLIRQELSVL